MKLKDLSELPEEKRAKLALGVAERRDMPMDMSEMDATTAEAGQQKIVGYAAMFNQPTQIVSWLTEIIADTAFDEALQRPDDVRALGNHKPDNLLGRTSNGTARLYKDSIGLRYEIDLPDTQYARDLYALIKRRDIRGSSFWFAVTSHELEYFDDGSVTRTITSLKLFDVGPVTFPQYEGATSEARSATRDTKRADELFDMLETRIRRLPEVAAPPTSETREHLNRKYRDEIALLERRLEGRK